MFRIEHTYSNRGQCISHHEPYERSESRTKMKVIPEPLVTGAYSNDMVCDRNLSRMSNSSPLISRSEPNLLFFSTF